MSRMNEAIAATVRDVVRTRYPGDYCSLCHIFAVVGANLASIALDRVFQPVAGLAVIDAGAGNLIYMADNAAFNSDIGGAYHCWIESCDGPRDDKQLIDLTFGHNRQYAQKNALPWFGGSPPRYLWGSYRDLVLDCDLTELRPGFGQNKIWLQATGAGEQWMFNHLNNHLNAYVDLTAMALKIYKKKYPRLSFHQQKKAAQRLSCT